MTTIGDRIRLRRVEKECSLAELARRANVSKGHLYSIESGETQSPSAELLFRIANELGTTMADLLGQEITKEAAKRLDMDELPSGLQRLALEEDLPDADIEMLARIEYRGKKPDTLEDWRYIYESIKRTLK